jgi:hypothetical protein
MKISIGNMRFTATHFLDNLAGGLYNDLGDCLAEIVRNGMVACMPEGEWTPRLGHVEIFLVDNHPLAPKTKSLVILDHGRGFTKQNMERYCTVGRAIGDRGDSHSGAAQKRIGRFAAFALNKRCRDDQDITTGFFILTRTAPAGDVTIVPMIPKQLELDRGELSGETISPLSTELGPQKGIKGCFTAIVVPNSVFENYSQIREALKYRVPRKAELMYRLEVDGRRMTTAPLDAKVAISQENGRIEAYMDRVRDRDDPNGGIWFTDAATGLRVAPAQALQRHLPYPIWKPDLIGDIFVPGLLANQGTSRTSLSPRYLSSAAWKKVQMYLLSQVVPAAKTLLGDDDVFGRDASSKSLLSFVERCNAIWGRPEDVKGGTGLFDEILVPKTRKTPTGVRTPGGSGGGGGGTPGVPTPPKPRAIPIRIGEKVFVLNKRLMDARVYAEVDRFNGHVIYINDQEYMAMPKTREARDEHVLLKVLEAAAQAEFDNPTEIMYYVAERRKELMAK